MAIVIPPLMDILLWGSAGLFAGVVAGHLGPALLAAALPEWAQAAVGDFYASGVSWAAKPMAFVEQRERGLTLERRSKDDDLDGDRLLGGLYRDELRSKKRLGGKLVAMATDRFPVFVSPFLAWVGRHADREARGGRFGKVADSGQTVGYSPFLPVPDKDAAAVKLSEAEPLLPGNASPESADESQDFTEVSQERFHEKVSLRDALIVVAAFATGGGMRFAIDYLQNATDGGGEVTLPGVVLPALEVLPL